MSTTASNVNLPNALTLARILAVPPFAWLLLHDGGTNPGWRWAALVVFLAAIFTDRLDGQIARSRNLITDFGKIADPIADKALIGTALVGLSLNGALWWWVTILILVRELGITLMRFVVIRYGVMAASRGGKLKTVLQSVAIGMYIAPIEYYVSAWTYLAALVMAAALVVTLVTGADYVAKAVQLRRSAQRPRRVE
ncbi:MAG: CDP-diacylglycerol--glycerol-3-phosphate 3-phosphatidyltransferase [Actinomycetales bacterium]